MVFWFIGLLSSKQRQTSLAIYMYNPSTHIDFIPFRCEQRKKTLILPFKVTIEMY